jgi:hypothetical protein
METWCHKLNLPKLNDLQINYWFGDLAMLVPDPSKNFFKRFDANLHISERFLNWLNDLGLFYIIGGYFYVPANGTIIPHVDGLEVVSICKINFRSGRPGSTMHWYRSNPGSDLILGDLLPGSTNIKDFYLYFKNTDIEEVGNMEHPEVCMHDAGQIHSFNSGPSPQHIISIVVGLNTTGKKLTWEEGCRVFENFIDR